MKPLPNDPFTFGIYPGGMSGTDTGLTTGPADSSQAIEHALRILQGDAPSFLVRAYVPYKSRQEPVYSTPPQPEPEPNPLRRRSISYRSSRGSSRSAAPASRRRSPRPSTPSSPRPPGRRWRCRRWARRRRPPRANPTPAPSTWIAPATSIQR